MIIHRRCHYCLLTRPSHNPVQGVLTRTHVKWFHCMKVWQQVVACSGNLQTANQVPWALGVPWAIKILLSSGWTRQTRFVLWAGSGQTDAPGACLTVLRYPSTRQSHWKCLSGFGEAAPARLPADLPDFREFPPGAAIPGNSREFPTPEISLPGNWPTIGRLT